MLKEQNITMEVSEQAKDFLLKLGYDISYGARPLKRIIQKYLINPLSSELLMGNFISGDTIFVDYKDGDKLIFNKK